MSLPSNLFLQKPIKEEILREYCFNLKDFDKDGFELTPIEKEYYKANLESIQGPSKLLSFNSNKICFGKELEGLKIPDNSNISISHSYELIRCGFSNQALEQIKNHDSLRKLLYIKPKWGLDIEYVYLSKKRYFTLFHIEYDFDSYEEYENFKKHIYRKIDNLNWNLAVLSAYFTDKYNYLSAESKLDMKAQILGLEKAYSTIDIFKI